jgi:hypothetical protein
MLVRIALPALLLLCIAEGTLAQSLCDGPFHWGSCPPESQGTVHQTQSDQRGTDANPLVMKEAATEESKAKAQYEAESEAAKASRERQIIWATWTIAIATSLLMIGTGFLARYTFRLWDETKRLARETKETGDAQIALADDTAKRQLRAYPGVTGARIDLAHSTIFIEIDVENFSTTPAYKFRHAISHQLCEPKDFKAPTDMAPKDMQWDMAPRTKTTMRDIGAISDPQIASLRKGDLKLFFCGRIDYEDAFREPRYIEFIYRNGDMSETSVVIDKVGMPKEMVIVYRSHEPEPVSYISN